MLLWIAYSYFTSRVSEPSFKVVKQSNGYTIRKYEDYIVAKVKVNGPYEKSMNEGFRILAGYIFGANTSKASIKMTAPVVEENKSESISMTAPVIEENSSNEERIVSFVMPKQYTLATLPFPNDQRIKFEQIPSHYAAVLTYSWYNTDQRVKEKKAELLNLLSQDAIPALSVPQGARFNPPWTIPFMLRNEVMVKIDYKE